MIAGARNRYVTLYFIKIYTYLFLHNNISVLRAFGLGSKATRRPPRPLGLVIIIITLSFQRNLANYSPPPTKRTIQRIWDSVWLGPNVI